MTCYSCFNLGKYYNISIRQLISSFLRFPMLGKSIKENHPSQHLVIIIRSVLVRVCLIII